jgi:hypothetical protein
MVLLLTDLASAGCSKAGKCKDMKTILVDAVDTLVIEGKGVFGPMLKLLQEYPNQKIIVTNADDQEMVEFSLTNAPFKVFSRQHKPN